MAVNADAIVEVARQHVGEPYVLGARAPMAEPDWTGPWDCAEFASWCVYQAAGVLYGTRPTDDPVMADAYTGFWAQQAEADDAEVSVEDALRIAGACLLRKPGHGRNGHVAFSTGDGRTVEAHSTGRGVVAGTARNRRWDCGVLVPGIRYFLNERHIRYTPPPRVLRITVPLTRGNTVSRLQKELVSRGYAAGSPDGVYGPQTASAVQAFQADAGLVADGEAGPLTLEALGLE